MAEVTRKAELIATLDRSRSQITTNVQALGHDLDFATRARRAFTQHPAVWIGGAIVIGLFISRLPLGRKKVPVARVKTKNEPAMEKAGKAGLVLGALKIAFDIAKPTIMGWATKRVADYFQSGNHGREPRY